MYSSLDFIKNGSCIHSDAQPDCKLSRSALSIMLGLGGKTEGKENRSLSPTMTAKRGGLNGYSPGDVAVSDELPLEGVRAKASGQASEMTLPCALPLKSFGSLRAASEGS